MSCDGSSCDIFCSGTVIWIDFICLYLHGGVSNSVLHGYSCEVCSEVLEFLKEVFCVDNP